MSKAILVNMAGTQVGEVELSEAVFGIEPNQTVVHEVVKNHLANCRQGTQSALTRAEVSGGGIKPWRQKGTGRARQGSTRAPQWTHGGIVFAPKPRDYSYVLNKKVKRLALKSALSAKAASGDIVVVDSLNLDEVKTKAMKGFLDTVGAKKAVVVTPEVNETVIKSARNIPGVVTTTAKIRHRGGVCVMATTAYDIIKRPIITEQSMAETEAKKYTFEVAKSANKIEIAKAVEEIFGVKVAKVNTLNMQGKEKRTGRFPAGRRPSWKKAMVTLTEDSKTIEFFEGMV